MKNIPWKTQLKAYFITGFLTIVPVMATIFLMTIAMKILLKLLSSPFLFLLETFFHVKISGAWLILFDVMGIGFGILCVLIIITLIGILTANIFGRTIFVWFETFLIKLPLISNFYGAIKQLMEILFSKGKNSFTRVVLVEYPRKGVFSVGFITAENNQTIGVITGERMVNIYLPTALNIASGFMLIVPAKDIIPLEISVEDGLKLVISGGFISPEVANGKGTE
ncbi:DUF502 domain-containing protein [bacterium]|nr:DUF502 domain-containing protein [bacterium]MBU1752984.1 DUF502 domain-containing protein [bacterium]